MKNFKLYNGVEIPVNGFGVYQVSKEDCKKSVLMALKAGYRHIDTAQAYFNEEEVGEALQECGIARNKIFLTTKVWIDHYGEGKTYASVIESLRKLKTDYIDLILLHQPICDYYGAYRDLEKLYEEGKVRAIGVSNFYPDRLVDLCLFAKIKPMVNQIEVNVFHQQIEAKKWADKYGVVVEAWAPFGEGKNQMFSNPTLQTIADYHHKSIAQVILRWLYQRGIVSLAKSTHENRIQENYAIFDFELTEDEMETIKKLDTNTSLFFDHRDPNMIEWFNQLIFQRRK